MKKLFTLFFLFFTSTQLFAQVQKIVSDCTVTYSISESGSVDNKNKTMDGATKNVYIKGKNVRSDIISSSYNQSVINNNTGEIIILREIGTNKYMSVLDEIKWKEQNKKFIGMSITLESDSKNILGYECKKAVAHLSDGKLLNLYYAPVIMPSVIDNAYQFKEIPGFIMEYESPGDGNNVITYTATKINFNPVPGAKFEIPTSGYRIL